MRAFHFESSPFRVLESPDWFKQPLNALAALSAELGALTTLADHLLLGTLLVALSSAIVVYASKHILTPELAFRSRSRLSLAFVLPIVFTAAALLPHLGGGYQFGGSGNAGTPVKARWGEARQGRFIRPPGLRGSSAELAYPGVVLWPKQLSTKLLAAPARSFKNPLNTARKSPLIIPFSGVYWFFKAPEVQLPRNPHHTHGSPELLNIHTTDMHALSMEAHQNFGTSINPSFCREIQIVIRNADCYPGTVSLELILIDTTLREKPSQSVGSSAVVSAMTWKLYDDRPVTTEILHFNVPVKSRISRFDELMVIFRLDPGRSFSAAKMGITSFILIPRT